MDMWGLKRNIILDASAKLCYEYKLNSNMYQLQEQKKIFDYNKWGIYWFNVNSTIRGKTRYEDFEKPINEITTKFGESKTLIVTTKDKDIMLKDKNNADFGYLKLGIFKGVVTHWEDFKGKNEYGELEHIIIEDSNWLWSSEYILKYLYYARKQEEIITDIKYIISKNRFDNETLQLIAESITANNYYQAIKRINRNMKYESKVCILCANSNIVDTIESMLPNSQMYDVEIDTLFVKKKIDKKPKKKVNINRFIELFEHILKNGTIPKDMKDIIESNEKYLKKQEKILQGIIPKHLIQDTLEIKSDRSFAKNVVHSNEVKQFLENNNIGGLQDKGQEKQNFVFPIKLRIEN